MKTTIIIHTENEDNLRKLFNLLNKKIEKGGYQIYLHSKGYFPWNHQDLLNEIYGFSVYTAYPTGKEIGDSILEILFKVKTEQILILDENSDELDFEILNRKELLKLNLDNKYKTAKWFINDILKQKDNSLIFEDDGSSDFIRFSQKITSELFNKKIIYIDGGLGDHIMALPLLESIKDEFYICCKYNFVYEHLQVKGFISWYDELFGGYSRFVYEYGSANNSNLIIDAFFEIYGYQRNSDDILKYNGKRDLNPEITTDKKILLICTSAAKINNQDSNKDWRDIRWFKLIHELKKKGYFVIQVGSKKDNQIPNVDFKFLDKPISNLGKLIEDCSLWISVDTFFHHFASSINPNVGICLTPFYNDHAKHPGVTYIEKGCGKDFSDRKWWMDLQQPERKECMDLIQIDDVIKYC